MFKTLFKKQFMEIMNFQKDRKDKKKIKKSAVKSNVIIWLVAMVIVAAFIGALAYYMGSNLIASGYSWAYFTIIGCMAIFFGAFGSVFNTYAALYKAKDNDLLLSMPIKPHLILATRILVVFLLSLMYSGCIWIPAIIVYWIIGKVSFVTVLYPILLILVLAIFVSAITCIVGGLIAYLSVKLKNTRFITITLTLLLMAGLYYVQFNLMNMVNNLIAHIDTFAAVAKSWLAPMYALGIGADGNHLGMFLFSMGSIVLFAIVYLVLSQTFIKLATIKISEKKNVFKEDKSKKSPVLVALVKKEARKFYSSTIYFLNAGLGLFIILVIGIVLLVKMNSIGELLVSLDEMQQGLSKVIPVAASMILCAVLGMNCITAPSISLEAKTLWQLRSLPIKSIDILRAKVLLGVIYNTLGIVIGGIMLAIALKLNILEALLVFIESIGFICVFAYVGILLNLKMPNMNWTTEVVPIKQSAPIPITLFGAMILGVVLNVPYIFIVNKLNSLIYMAIVSIVLYAGCFGLDYLLKTKGVNMLEKL